MEYRIDPDERARFKRCRRQWDFASPHRRDLAPVEPLEDTFAAAVNDALAVYYYPGTWDWPHDLKQSLVHKALARALDDGDAATLDAAVALLDCYDAWARIVDDFAPVKIGQDVRALVPDPYEPERGLLTPDGSGVFYGCRVDLLAVDAADDYWLVRHEVVDDWHDPQSLIRDEEAVAACWAWEQDYLSMQIAGTIHNEVRNVAPLQFPDETTEIAPQPKAVAQHGPSGGGRSIPQHQRVSAQESKSANVIRFDQRTAGVLRRTRIRRRRDEIGAVGIQLAAEAGDMVTEPAVYPNPAAHCAACDFNAPCLALFEGDDPAPMLADRFRPRSAGGQPTPRLGQATWGFGRGAAPPRWS